MASDQVGFAAVEEASRRLDGRIDHTPVVPLRALEAELGVPVRAKAELLQRTGSFKVRGALNKVLGLDPEARRAGVATFSAGNHALATAYAAAAEGIEASVMMWRTASPWKIAATRKLGAQVDTDAADPAEAFGNLEALLARDGCALVHPFDDPDVIAGQGTVGLELCGQVEDVDLVVVPTSGGGLLSGVALAVKELRPGARVIAVQTAASPSLAAALDAGGPVRFEQRKTAADALTAPFFGDACFEVCRERVDEVVLLEEDELIAGFRHLYENAKLAPEVGGAAGVAALLAGRIDLRDARSVAVLVSGGNVEPAVAARLLGPEGQGG
jgi:threonine dehydratase